MDAGTSHGWRLLRRELGGRRRPLAAIAAWSLLQAAPATCGGIFLAEAIDRGFLAGRPLTGFGWLAAIGVISLVAQVGRRQTFDHLADVVEPLRDRLTGLVVSGTLHTAAAAGRADDRAGAARVTGQVETVRNVVSALLRSLNQLGLSVIAAAAGLIALAPAVLVVVVPCLLVAVAVFVLAVRLLYARRQALVRAEERVAAVADQVFAGARDVEAMQAHRQALGEVTDAIDGAARSARILSLTGLLNSVVTLVGGQLPVIIVLLAAPHLLNPDQLTAGVILGAVTYLRGQLAAGLGSVMGLVSGWGLQLGATLQRIDDVGRRPVADLPAEPATPIGYGLRATDLTFAYGPTATPVLDGFTLTVEEGEHLAILGTSGVGKSTLASLLSGLLDGQRGQVELGGVPLPRIAPDLLRRLVAVIPQEAYVFDGTLRENLTYLNPTATGSDLDRAVDALGMRALVDRLGGYQARFAAGDAGLSSGERQLVGLARTYLSAAPLVILDEATCHLDPVAETRVERAFVRRHGTLVVIAHRISSALRARRVLLLEGSGASLGTHDELLRSSAHYRDLVAGWDARPDLATAALRLSANAPAAASSSGSTTPSVAAAPGAHA
jgi:ABC-type multidrug transport system fused ATPase/permease subunit